MRIWICRSSGSTSRTPPPLRSTDAGQPPSECTALSSKRRTSRMAGLLRRLWHTQTGTPVCRTAPVMRCISATVLASGFSTNTGLPAARAGRMTSARRLVCVASTIKSTSGRLTTSCQSVQLVAALNVLRNSSARRTLTSQATVSCVRGLFAMFGPCQPRAIAPQPITATRCFRIRSAPVQICVEWYSNPLSPATCPTGTPPPRPDGGYRAWTAFTRGSGKACPGRL